MEPNIPQPEAIGGRNPVEGGEKQYPQQPETLPISPEKHDESREQKTGAGTGDAAPSVVQSVPLPPPALKPITEEPSQQPISGTPMLAADDDLIEKEWVDKAKKIIAETKHDPYLQEQEVSKLQADYLQKRYGKTVKQSDG